MASDVSRIAFVPVFITLLIYYRAGLVSGTPVEDFRWTALVIFVAVAATDALDGYLARSRNEVTDFGRMLDPIADKLLVVSSLLLLTRPGLLALELSIQRERLGELFPSASLSLSLLFLGQDNGLNMLQGRGARLVMPC